MIEGSGQGVSGRGSEETNRGVGDGLSLHLNDGICLFRKLIKLYTLKVCALICLHISIQSFLEKNASY